MHLENCIRKKKTEKIEDKEKQRKKVLQRRSTTGRKAGNTGKEQVLRKASSSVRISTKEEPQQVKLQRAQGECLGTDSRRRTRQAAKSCGKEQISYDPQVSEWGNPARVSAWSRAHEYIVCAGETERTETSK